MEGKMTESIDRHNSAEELLAAKNGDEKKLAEIVESNMGLVKSIALKFLRRGVSNGTEYEDLVQIGTIGMIKAVKNFDPSYECLFSTYAVPMITGEIKRFLRDDGLIKVSRGIKRNAALIAQFKNDFSVVHGREPDIDEISEKTGITLEDIIIAEEASMQVMSLCTPDDSENTLSPEERIGEDIMEDVFDKLALNEAVSKLSEHEKLLVKLRFYHGLTQKAAADILKTTQVSVSREEKKIIEKLRKLMD